MSDFLNLNKPKVSIILPTYNGAKYLSDSIESIINQTFADWELIIVNDCSTDNTLEIIQKFADNDKRIKIINNPVNKKLPASLNVGFSYAKGQYFTWTSDDNLYKPEALKKMVQYLDLHPQADLISMNSDYIDENGNYQHNFADLFAYERVAANLLQHNNVGAAFMYRKEIADKVGLYDDFTFCAEDYDYWCRIALAGNIEYTDDNIYQYRINFQSLSATKRAQVVEKTYYVQKKYMEAFFAKFKYSMKDRILVHKHLKLPYSSKAEFGYVLYLFFVSKIIKLLSKFIFWSKHKRRNFRKQFSPLEKFSFLKRKDKK